jgi:hypothetical protein
MKLRRLALVSVFIALATGGEAQEPKAAPQGQGGSAPTLDQVFGMLDRDRDGRIAKEEAIGAYSQRFPTWDTNGDGFASREEVRAYRTSIGFDDQGVFKGKSQPPAGKKKGVGPRIMEAAAQILKEPKEWRLERFPVPPPFALDIKFTGSEEARFAPGMYDATSSEYFTYIMAFALDGNAPLAAADFKDLVEKYFGGLSVGVGRQKGLTIDRSQIVATVASPSATPPMENRFHADLVFFDSFTDGRKITLHLDAQVMPRPDAKKNYLILLVSPAAKDSKTWEMLREIGKKAVADLP